MEFRRVMDPRSIRQLLEVGYGYLPTDADDGTVSNMLAAYCCLEMYWNFVYLSHSLSHRNIT